MFLRDIRVYAFGAVSMIFIMRVTRRICEYNYKLIWLPVCWLFVLKNTHVLLCSIIQ